MTTLRLAWLFARRSASARSTIILPVLAFAVVTALLLIVAGGAQAFFSWTDDEAGLYQLLAVVALSLLVVPLVVLGGSGTLDTADVSLPLRRGATVLTAHGDGPIALSGDLELIRCLPPR